MSPVSGGERGVALPSPQLLLTWRHSGLLLQERLHCGDCLVVRHLQVKHRVPVLHVELEQPAPGGGHQRHEVRGDADPGQTKPHPGGAGQVRTVVQVDHLRGGGGRGVHGLNPLSLGAAGHEDGGGGGLHPSQRIHSAPGILLGQGSVHGVLQQVNQYTGQVRSGQVRSLCWEFPLLTTSTQLASSKCIIAIPRSSIPVQA